MRCFYNARVVDINTRFLFYFMAIISQIKMMCDKNITPYDES